MATQSWTTLKLPMAQLAMVELNRLTNALFELCDRAHYLEIPGVFFNIFQALDHFELL